MTMWMRQAGGEWSMNVDMPPMVRIPLGHFDNGEVKDHWLSVRTVQCITSWSGGSSVFSSAFRGSMWCPWEPERVLEAIGYRFEREDEE